MKCTITINMDNAAFEDHPASELARILRHAAARAEDGADDFPLADVNGNTVGRLIVASVFDRHLSAPYPLTWSLDQ